jgi:RNA polymerase sigma factor (sigma-70 family)
MKAFPAGMAGDQVARAQAGDPEALNSLCADLWPWAVAWVKHRFPGLNEPEDVVGSFCLHLLENECACLRRCRDPAAFPAWLEQSLANWCRNEWNRQQRTERRESDWPTPSPEEGNLEFPWENWPEGRYGRPERELLRQEWWRVVDEAIRRLPTRHPERDRAILERRLIQDQTDAEIGPALGLPPAFVRKQYALLRQVLGRELSAAGYSREVLMGWAGELCDPRPAYPTPAERSLKAQMEEWLARADLAPLDWQVGWWRYIQEQEVADLAARLGEEEAAVWERLERVIQAVRRGRAGGRPVPETGASRWRVAVWPMGGGDLPPGGGGGDGGLRVCNYSLFISHYLRDIGPSRSVFIKGATSPSTEPNWVETTDH